MDTSRDDVSIAIRSAFLRKGGRQKLSLFFLLLLSMLFLFFETLESKPLNYVRSAVKDIVYRGSLIISSPLKGISLTTKAIKGHINLYDKYNSLRVENDQLKEKINKTDYLTFENTQLRKLVDEPEISSNFISARVMLDKQSPYINSFIINSGSNKKIKKGMAVLDGANFIGRIVDVNFFSSRILLISDLNSKIPILVEPSGNHAILSGRGLNEPTLDYLPEVNSIDENNKVYTSGKEGIFSPGMPIGQVKIQDGKFMVTLFSDLTQITFVNIKVGDLINIK